MLTFRSEADGSHVLMSIQDFPQSREAIYPFFADARNLARITPPNLGFQILTPASSLQMREGLLIDYRIRMRGIPIRWRTRIALWDPPFAFVDEQLRGPYALWHHTHRFEQIMSGDGEFTTRMTDIVRYRPPGGRIIGGIANRLFVRKELRSIFTFRRRVLEHLFVLDSRHARADRDELACLATM